MGRKDKENWAKDYWEQSDCAGLQVHLKNNNKMVCMFPEQAEQCGTIL